MIWASAEGGPLSLAVGRPLIQCSEHVHQGLSQLQHMFGAPELEMYFILAGTRAGAWHAPPMKPSAGSACRPVRSKLIVQLRPLLAPPPRRNLAQHPFPLSAHAMSGSRCLANLAGTHALPCRALSLPLQRLCLPCSQASSGRDRWQPPAMLALP